MTIIDKFYDKVASMNSPIILGLDARPDYIPSCVKNRNGRNIIGFSKALLEYNKEIIDSVYDIIPAVKIQVAYFEMFGIYGFDAYKVICDYAKEKGMIVIGDAKRGDISPVSKAYSNAYIGRTLIGEDEEVLFDTDFVTINPYFGSDTISPFIEDCKMYDKGVFVVVKSSNKSSCEVQDIVAEDGIKVWEKVAKLVNEWGKERKSKGVYSNIGAVVGANTIHEFARLRELMPNTFLIVSGYSEKKETSKLIRPLFDESGNGAVVSVSKNIMVAYKSENWSGIYKEEEFGSAARAEATRIITEINKYRGHSNEA